MHLKSISNQALVAHSQKSVLCNSAEKQKAPRDAGSRGTFVGRAGLEMCAHELRNNGPDAFCAILVEE